MLSASLSISQAGQENGITILSLLVLSAICYILLAPFVSGLRSFPGPFAAKVSSFWLVRQCRLTRRSKAVMEQHRKLGDFVRIAPNHISINNPAAVMEIYGHKSGFVKGPFYDSFLQVTPVVFNARNVHQHQRKRRFLNPAFSARALGDFESIMDEDVCKWKLKLLEVAHTDTVELDLVVWTNFLAFDVIGSFAFGQSFGFIEKGEDLYDLIRTIDKRGEVLNALGTVPVWMRPLMRYNYFDRFWPDGLQATANLGKIGIEAYNRRKATSDPRKDLLSYLFAAKDSKSNEPVTDQEIIAESISFIVGGSDTTSSTITNFFDFMSRDLTLQEQLADEIDNAFPGERDDTWVPSNNDLANLPLVNAVLREVMRICPTSSTGLERITPQEGKIIAGTFIPGGTIVSVPTCGLLADERVFETPHRFRPERWLAPDSKELLEHFLPFSTGPRACIGRNFAWMEMLKAIAVVIKYFRLERVTKSETIIREGFFNKATECRMMVSSR